MNLQHIREDFFYSMGQQLKNTINLTHAQAKALKHQLLNNGSYYLYKQTKKHLNLIKPQYKTLNEELDTGELITTLSPDYYVLSEKEYKQLEKDITTSGLKQCEKIDTNKYKRTMRLRKRVSQMIYSQTCYFITLTFDNKTLENTNEDTRRQLVRRFLKSQCTEYVANIDYGKTTEREHYHAITNAFVEGWAYGFYNVKAIDPNTESEKRIPMYITKLTHHALKQTVKGSYLIYSRT